MREKRVGRVSVQSDLSTLYQKIEENSRRSRIADQIKKYKSLNFFLSFFTRLITYILHIYKKDVMQKRDKTFSKGKIGFKVEKTTCSDLLRISYVLYS